MLSHAANLQPGQLVIGPTHHLLLNKTPAPPGYPFNNQPELDPPVHGAVEHGFLVDPKRSMPNCPSALRFVSDQSIAPVAKP